MPILQPKQIFETYEVHYLIKENRYCETYRVEDEDKKSYFLKLYVKDRMPPRLVGHDGTIPSNSLCKDLYADAILSVMFRSFVSIEGVGDCEYIVTEYYAGELLEDILNRDVVLSFSRALKIYRDIIHGLNYLHSHYPPLVHNDITPRNILITNDGHVKIIDLGHLSYVKNSSGRPPFDTDDLDVRYQAAEVSVYTFNEKTDIFSATAVLYHMLFGTPPWNPMAPNDGEWQKRMAAVMLQRVRGGVLDLSEVKMPEALREIIRKGLSFNVRERYNSTKIVLADLGNIDPSEPSEELDSDQEGAEHEENNRPKGFEAIAGMNDLKKMLTSLPLQPGSACLLLIRLWQRRWLTPPSTAS